MQAISERYEKQKPKTPYCKQTIIKKEQKRLSKNTVFTGIDEVGTNRFKKSEMDRITTESELREVIEETLKPVKKQQVELTKCYKCWDYRHIAK